MNYYWGFNHLIINQSYSVPMSPTPAPTDFDYDYAQCPSYALELSDFTLFHEGGVNALITDSQVNSVGKWNSGVYTFWFQNQPSKTSEWLLQSSTYASIKGTSSTVLKLDIYEPDNIFCKDPILTVTDSAQFVSIIFSLVFAVYNECNLHTIIGQ